jgi:predicted ester cyclase
MSLPEKNSSQEKENKTLIESFVEEIFNKHNLSATENYLNPVAGKGNREFKEFLSAFFKAFPDWHANIERIVAEDNLVVIFLNGFGTHQGEFQGMPPTRKPVNIRSADLYRIENGIIVEHRDVVDQLNLLQQTGATL